MNCVWWLESLIKITWTSFLTFTETCNCNRLFAYSDGTNRLNLNPSKTQLIWFGTWQQLLKLDHKLTVSTFPDFTFLPSVRDLGVTLDSELTFAEHVSFQTRSCSIN